MRLFLFILSAFLISCGHTVYIVRHAEKAAPGAMMSGDVPLTPAGEQRALALKETLKDKRIGMVYSTNTIRTRSTAKPVADFFGLTILTYTPQPDSAFIAALRKTRKNILVVGHSNTVDDIANKLCGRTVIPGDLPDPAYDNLFVVKRKGKHFTFRNNKYGNPTP